MPLDLAIVKQHPAASAGIAIVTATIAYLATRHGSVASPSSSTSPVFAATSQGTDVAAQGYNAQIAVAQLGAEVAAKQTGAALAAQESNNQTAIALAEVTTGATTQQAQISADASTEISATNAQAATEIAANYTNGQVAIAAQNASAVAAKTNLVASVVSTAQRDKAKYAGDWATIIAAIEGQGPEAIAANQPTTVANQNKTANIIKAAADPITSFLSKIF